MLIGQQDHSALHLQLKKSTFRA